jgi:GNAT superfamily N-acetyltransferase
MEFIIRECLKKEEGVSWAIEDQVWPTFNQLADGSIGIDYDPNLHLVAQIKDTGQLVATIDAIEIDWDGNPDTLPKRGWTEIIEDGLIREELDQEIQTDWVAALGTSVLPDYQKFGLSKKLLEELIKKAKALGYKGMIAPVRPIYRFRMPDLTINEYSQVRLDNGEHFDPWLRIHERIGGKIIGVCPASAVFSAPLNDWQDWSKMKLPESGRLLVPNAINYLEIKDGVGVLKEDSVWVLHS